MAGLFRFFWLILAAIGISNLRLTEQANPFKYTAAVLSHGLVLGRSRKDVQVSSDLLKLTAFPCKGDVCEKVKVQARQFYQKSLKISSNHSENDAKRINEFGKWAESVSYRFQINRIAEYVLPVLDTLHGFLLNSPIFYERLSKEAGRIQSFLEERRAQLLRIYEIVKDASLVPFIGDDADNNDLVGDHVSSVYIENSSVLVSQLTIMPELWTDIRTTDQNLSHDFSSSSYSSSEETSDMNQRHWLMQNLSSLETIAFIKTVLENVPFEDEELSFASRKQALLTLLPHLRTAIFDHNVVKVAQAVLDSTYGIFSLFADVFDSPSESLVDSFENFVCVDTKIICKIKQSLSIAEHEKILLARNNLESIEFPNLPTAINFNIPLFGKGEIQIIGCLPYQNVKSSISG